jgi:hypothetical protein
MTWSGGRRRGGDQSPYYRLQAGRIKREAGRGAKLMRLPIILWAKFREELFVGRGNNAIRIFMFEVLDLPRL